jgi:hypothetical protein
MKAKLAYLLALALLAACQAPPTATPSATVPAPTVTRVTPTARPTQTPLPPTATASPSATPIPTITSTPTRAPSEAFWENLERFPVVSAMTVGPGGFLYTAYIMSVSTLRGECHLYVVRTDGRQEALIFEIDDLEYCEVVDWDNVYSIYTESAVRAALGLQGYWSDMNGNGLPELTVMHYSGAVSGDEANWGRYAVYEIEGVSEVSDLTAQIPGTILPEQLLHSADPLTIYVHEWVMYELHQFVDMTWNYEWDGDRYVDVSARYPDEYRQQVDETVAQLRANYGQPMTFWDANVERMQRILVTYNELGFPQDEGLALFLEVTDPVHWPGWNLCWLQAARANAIIDEEAAHPFTLLPTIVIGALDQAEAMARGIDPERFDVSACQ